MEAVAASYTPDHQPISPCKQIKAMPRRNHHHNHRSFTVEPSLTSTVQGGGGGGHVLLFTRPPPPSRSLSFPCPPPSSPPPPISNPLGFNNVPPHHNQGQPPLLPLPKPYSSLSLPPPNSNMRTNKPKSSSLTPKKSSPKHPKRQDPNNKRKDSKNPGKSPSTSRSANSSADKDVVAVLGSTCSMGPDPDKLPRNVFVSKGSLRGDVGFRSLVLEDLEKFPGYAMSAISPPPSSLPLPKFSLLRPKQLSCNAEAAGVDAGPSDDLRRILRLP